MQYTSLPIVFRDDDRGIQYSATATGNTWPAERATGPSYSSGGEPGCDAGCEVESIDIESMEFDGKPTKSKYGIEAKLDTDDPCYRGFCDEVLEDLSSVIHDKFMEAASGEAESRRASAADAKYEAMRERNGFYSRLNG